MNKFKPFETMKRNLLISTIALTLCCYANKGYTHCQMPCGIYHDNMVFDQIDQYVETMYKGISVLKTNKFDTVRERNEFVRWVIQKEKASDEVSEIISTYFLQQKIKPDEEDTVKRVVSAHKLLFLAVQIKQNVDIKILENFADEWEDFKQMFHVVGYECAIEQVKMRKRQHELQKAQEEKEHNHTHEHPHDHDHPHNHEHAHDHSHDHDHPHKMINLRDNKTMKE